MRLGFFIWQCVGGKISSLFFIFIYFVLITIMLTLIFLK